ncbi:MAG: hypothetical protein CM1200mP2_33990 [Planctomycetaceae bacterium]|nr:MAG: hypothetical protein CM1200mP2_33990 [Planctomycetaceae bacterium]
MYRKGFVSRLQLETQRENVEIANKSVRVAQIKLEALLKFTRAKSIAAFKADIAKQQAVLTAAERKLDLSRQKLSDLTQQKANCRILAPKAARWSMPTTTSGVRSGDRRGCRNSSAAGGVAVARPHPDADRRQDQRFETKPGV